MRHNEKIEKLKEFKNENEFREFLIDFLKKKGFKEVQHTHKYGAPELGKDIIAKVEHPVEGTEWYAFVVKIGKISGGTNEIQTIKNQIKQSFEYPYESLNNGEIRINKVKVVTNENFTKGAQKSLNSSQDLKLYNNYSYWWNEQLIGLIDECYPEFWLPGNRFLKEYSKSLNNKIQNEFEIKELSIRKIEDTKVQKLLNIFIEPQLTELKVNEDNKKEKNINKKRIKISEVINSKSNFILSSEPGGGKTKVLNIIARELTDTKNFYEKKIIPIKLNVLNLRENEFDITKTIYHNINFLIPEMYDKFNIDDFGYVILIDSIHQLAKDEEEILTNNLREFTEKYKSRFIITQRTNNDIEFTGLNSELREISIKNFNTQQVEDFITKYFERNERGQKFIEILKESNLLSKLPTTPLTVTLLALLYDDSNYEIPATLTDIYDDFTSILLGKLEIKNRTDLLQMNIKKRIFTALALEMLDSNKFNCQYDEFKQFVNGFLTSKGYQAQDDEALSKIINQSGLLFLDDENIVGFKQQAFAEYFSSIEIYDHKRKTHYHKLLENFNVVSWQNTAIFYGGRSKDLPEMIDDLMAKIPNDNLRDWFINTGGMGYLSQALYLTDKTHRKKLIYKALDNLNEAFKEMKNLSKEETGLSKDLPLPFIASILGHWFNENFKSITLKQLLIEVFDELLIEYKDAGNHDFVGDFKMFLVASTLVSKYIDYWDCFEKLIERDSFIKNPTLMVAGDTFFEIGDINRKSVDKELREKIVKSINKHRELIKYIIKEPAYRFGNDYKLIEKE
ncbi:MAG: NACHT domain-containing protein [bacterium]